VRRLRVGVIGSGWVANARHIPGFQGHPDADVVAVLDHNGPRAQETATRHSINLATADARAFFAADLDVVSICTPPWSHAELAIESLAHGCHVFTEKPMAVDANDARAMIEAAAAADRRLCVSHNFLFSRSVRRADRLLAGAGAPEYVAATQLSSPRRRLPEWYEQLPAGLFLDESPHMLYTMQHFLGPLILEGVRSRSVGGATPATVELQVRGPVAHGQITTVFTAPVSEWHVTVVTNDRLVDLDLFRDIVVDVPPDNQHKASDILGTSARAITGHLAGFAASGARLVTRRQFWGHDALISAFVDAVATDRPSPVDPVDSLRIVEITDQVLDELGVARTSRQSLHNEE
jgi:predicted dehydrogenase